MNHTEQPLPAVGADSYDLAFALLLPLPPIAAFGALADPYINPWSITERVNDKWCAIALPHTQHAITDLPPAVSKE